MKRFAILFAFLAFAGGQLLFSQAMRISGTVTSSDDGLPVPGASVVVRGTTFGTITDFDGKYTFNVPAGTQILVFSFVGLKTQEISIDGRDVIDVVMEPDVFGLDEVVVSGVASGTPRKKLSVTVATVGEQSLKEVPASSAASALQGKLAGVKVVQAAGYPGSAASIRLRGATAIRGSQAPMIIVDGVILEGTLADINVDDIESMEVVKGAAASALYGSRAGNGVVVVRTKRGQGLAAGETVVTVRNEYGQSQLQKRYPVAKSHFYVLSDDWASENRYTKFDNVLMYGDLPEHTNPDSLGIFLSGSRNIDPDHYMDNPFGVVYDHFDTYYQTGQFYTNYVSVATNHEKTNFLVSFENSKQSGIIFEVGGYNRQNFRFNIDHRFSDKFTFSTSNLIIKTKTDNGAFDFFSLMQLQPDMNLLQKNPDGSDYRLKVDQFGTTINPLYQLANVINFSRRNRILSSYNFAYFPVQWLKLDAQYSFERQSNDSFYEQPKGYILLSTYPDGSEGYASKGYGQQLAQTLQFTANFNKQFGDFTTRAKLSYLYEDNHWEGFSTFAYAFTVGGIPQLGNMDQTTAGNSSYVGDIRAENIFGILDLDYKGKYIGSFLYRYDGASQFGENERWNPYFRVSGAYRISEDVTIPGIDELKIRAAHGTSGNRPPWNAQYETFNVTAGSITKVNLGNKNLKPSTIRETEAGLNLEFLKKFDFEFVYSVTNAEDQHYPVPLSAAAGYQTQWQNMGTLQSKSLEATLGMRLVQTKDISWSANLAVDRIRTEVTELNVAPFTMGARGNPGDPGAYFIEVGTIFGTVYGDKFLRSLDEMAEQIELLELETTIDDYTINSDGYVIEKGTEGTLFEKPITLKDEDGVVKNVPIGDANPDFNLTITNTFSWKGLTAYALFDWKQGGDIYNLTNQWMYRDNRSIDQDQAGKEEYKKKTYDYYNTLYNVAGMNSHFVEDGSYLKLRELSIYYQPQTNVLSNILGGFFKSFRIGIQGRNLYTWTHYSGWDPEIGTTEGAGDNTIQAWDEFSYPNYRTFTGSLEFKF